jgi:restriction endonuclease S subunit
MSNWDFKKLESFASIGMGETIISHELSDNGLPVFSANTDPLPWGYVRQSKKKYRRGTIVIGARGSLGFPRLPDLDAYTSTQTTIYIEPKNHNSMFLYQFLQSVDFNSIGAQQAVPMLTVSQVGKIQVPTPPLPEQSKIAEILSSVDQFIELTEKKISKLEDLKIGLMTTLLKHGIYKTNLKSSPFGKIPQNWKVSNLSKSARIFNNLRKPINAQERKLIQGIYPYYGPTKIQDFLNEYRIDGTFVLIGEDGDHFLKFNRMNMTQLAVGKFNVNNHAHVLQGTEECETKWLFYFFLHRDITSNLTRQGAGRYKLTKETLLNLEIAVPPLDEQRQIIKIFDCVQSTCKANSQKLDKLLDLKNALMNDLLTGKVRVKV